MTSPSARLELTWPNKDKFLLVPKDDTGKPVWVEPDHPAAREVRLTDFAASHGEVNDDDPHGDNLLFTGDACVNGPYNYMGDGDSARWIDTLRAARRLNPLVVCPGHGLVGGPEILDQQLEYFVTLQAEVRLLVHRGLSPAHVKLAADVIRVKLQANDRIARYVGGMFLSQVGKFYTDLSGKAFETAWRLSPEAEAAFGPPPPGRPRIRGHRSRRGSWWPLIVRNASRVRRR